jgi:hypothetical protein
MKAYIPNSLIRSLNLDRVERILIQESTRELKSSPWAQKRYGFLFLKVRPTSYDEWLYYNRRSFASRKLYPFTRRKLLFDYWGPSLKHLIKTGFDLLVDKDEYNELLALFGKEFCLPVKDS